MHDQLLKNHVKRLRKVKLPAERKASYAERQRLRRNRKAREAYRKRKLRDREADRESKLRAFDNAYGTSLIKAMKRSQRRSAKKEKPGERARREEARRVHRTSLIEAMKRSQYSYFRVQCNVLLPWCSEHPSRQIAHILGRSYHTRKWLLGYYRGQGCWV